MKAILVVTFLLLPVSLMAIDFPVAFAESTFQNSNYVSEVWSSTLSNSPAWDAEKTPPPLNPKRAGVLAVQSAYVQLGNNPAWPQLRFGEPAWSVDEVSLVQAVHDDFVGTTELV